MTLKKFLDLLPKTPRDWRFDNLGRIRRGGRDCDCPITSVAPEGWTSPTRKRQFAPKDAGHHLGLREGTMEDLIWAADHDGEPDNELRKQLVKACGLKE